MKKVVVIHQPDFLPYLGFFHRLIDADHYVALDHVQFVTGTKRSWTHRDIIKTPKGAQWVTVSVRKAPLGTAINEIELADNDWRTQNLNQIKENYRQSQYFDEIYFHLERLYAEPYTRLVDFTLASINMLLTLFDIRIPCVMSNTMGPRGKKNDMLVDILTKVGATHYLSGIGARAYLDPMPFNQAGIAVVWQEFTHPVYPQLHGEFIPCLSSIDILFNCGIERSREFLRSC